MDYFIQISLNLRAIQLRERKMGSMSQTWIDLYAQNENDLLLHFSRSEKSRSKIRIRQFFVDPNNSDICKGMGILASFTEVHK